MVGFGSLAARRRPSGTATAVVSAAEAVAPEEVPPRLPRYARVNTLKTSVRHALAALRREGFVVVRAPRTLLRRCPPRSPVPCRMWRDAHLRSLLVLPLGCELHAHEMVASGALVLQDKASCFPPAAIAPPLGAVAVDCCAAPG